MISLLRNSFKISSIYSINSVIYYLKKIPIIGVFLPNNMYEKKILKNIIYVLVNIYRLLKNIFFSFLYFFIIYFISTLLFPNNISNSFIYIYILFTLIGVLYSSKLFSSSSKNYFSVILFGMDAKKYVKANLVLEVSNKFIFQFIFLSIFFKFLNINLLYSIFLSIFSSCCLIISEGINLKYYVKYKSFLLNNRKCLLIVFIMFLLLSLPYFNIPIYFSVVFILCFLSIIIGVYFYNYLNNYEFYKILYKRINTLESVMTMDDDSFYSKQNILEIKDKDKFIDPNKIKGKEGYELFNTIFFERHKQILLRSAYICTLFILLGIIICFGIVSFMSKYKLQVNDILSNNLGIFLFIMYFINRGVVLTRAMFYHCDHAMLTFNFYRNPKVILSLFKTRLLTIVKVNLIPASVLGMGLFLIYLFVGGSLIDSLMIFVFIIVLSVFFSVHYLVLYYLMQPFNKNLEIKDFRYNLVCFLTYYIIYLLLDIRLSSLLFSLYGIIFTVAYILIALILVYKLAPKTFKLS